MTSPAIAFPKSLAPAPKSRIIWPADSNEDVTKKFRNVPRSFTPWINGTKRARTSAATRYRYIKGSTTQSTQATTSATGLETRIRDTPSTQRHQHNAPRATDISLMQLHTDRRHR